MLQRSTYAVGRPNSGTPLNGSARTGTTKIVAPWLSSLRLSHRNQLNLVVDLGLSLCLGFNLYLIIISRETRKLTTLKIYATQLDRSAPNSANPHAELKKGFAPGTELHCGLHAAQLSIEYQPDFRGYPPADLARTFRYLGGVSRGYTTGQTEQQHLRGDPAGSHHASLSEQRRNCLLAGCCVAIHGSKDVSHHLFGSLDEYKDAERVIWVYNNERGTYWEGLRSSAGSALQPGSTSTLTVPTTSTTAWKNPIVPAQLSKSESSSSPATSGSFMEGHAHGLARPKALYTASTGSRGTYSICNDDYHEPQDVE